MNFSAEFGTVGKLHVGRHRSVDGGNIFRHLDFSFFQLAISAGLDLEHPAFVHVGDVGTR